ncbi:MAG TPA: arginine deiminase-related protein [Gammaproteobacteria bacterium]
MPDLPDRRSGEAQAAAAVLMVRPEHFASNPETLETNRFQAAAAPSAAATDAARREHDGLAVRLAAAGVRVHAFRGWRAEPLPDEVFPNNWVSLHADGTVVLYPMLAPSRRRERRRELLEALAERYRVTRVVDLTALEERGEHLEGTGSLVLDRPRRVAYAALSPRTTPGALAAFAAEMGYEVVAFRAADRAGVPIYHTNVLMALGTRFAVVCSAAIPDATERQTVVEGLQASGRIVVDLSFAQLESFAGNLLELRGRAGPVIALSARALASLAPGQRTTLAAHGRLVAADIATIERLGGGSVRCTLAEIHLPDAP